MTFSRCNYVLVIVQMRYVGTVCKVGKTRWNFIPIEQTLLSEVLLKHKTSAWMLLASHPFILT